MLDLEELNNDWIGKFDWVYSRGVSHLHYQDLYTPACSSMVTNLLSYLKPDGRLLVIYWTDQSGKDSVKGHHWNHPLSDLQRMFSDHGQVLEATMVGNYAHLLITNYPLSEEVDEEQEVIEEST